MTIWHWVRHGPTHATSFVGWRDVPADLSNAEQIARVRGFLPDAALVISSDLSRAVDTADAVAPRNHMRLGHDPGLREMHFGLWDGMHFDAVSDRDPTLSRAYWETPGNIQAPGGESWHMAAARVNSVVARLSSRHPDAEIVAVAHFGVILTQVQQALAVSPYEALAHRIDNLSVTTIELNWEHRHVRHINHHP